MDKTHNPLVGLTPDEVLHSRARHGSNTLTPPRRKPLWRQLAAKFADPLIVILLCAGALSVLIAVYERCALGAPVTAFFEPVGIFVAILLATVLAFYFEHRAESEFAVLNRVSDDEPVQVLRAGGATQVPRRDIVVGDIVVLNTGDEVPADGLLVEATGLQVDESTLTGEPMCRKTTDAACFDADATLDTNRVMRGTKVMEGHAVMRVDAVGDHTEQGRVYEAVQIDHSVRTPLDEQLDRLGAWVARMSYCVGAAVVAGRVLMYFADGSQHGFVLLSFMAYLLQTLMIAVTLVVVSVPEGLPMAVTLSLAYSMRRMLKTNNLVRRMHACETMGAATVICTDKTGTLTDNRMRVAQTQFYGVSSTASAVTEGMAVNSTAQLDTTHAGTVTPIGNPTEAALLMWLHGHGIDYAALRGGCDILEQLPFSADRKYMATVVRSGLMPGKRVLYVKGAPEIVMQMCCTMGEGATRQRVAWQLAEWQDHAMRTLGFAFQVLDDGEPSIDCGRVVAARLHFMGIVAIADPVRADVPAAVAECVGAGIKIKMVTGDTPATAREIGREIGLCSDADTAGHAVMTGPEFAALDDVQLAACVDGIKIIARARPMDKRRLVEALQRKGEVVAVTGDGTNDAPALRAAHVGLSMGSGTAVAKEASDITIIDNSFASIGKAVMWGRSLYRNIQRFLLFQLTVNVTACLTVLVGAFTGTESPLTVTQMLWINLIMDTFAAMALASLPPSESVMHDRPRNRRAFILDRPMKREIFGVGVVLFCVVLAFMLVFKHADIHCLADMAAVDYGALLSAAGHMAFWTGGHLSPYELTLLFTIFVMTHFFYLFDARAFATHRSALHLRGCRGLLLIAAIILAGQVVMVELPVLQQFFSVVSLRPADWAWIVAGSSMVLWVREIWHRIAAGSRIFYKY